MRIIDKEITRGYYYLKKKSIKECNSGDIKACFHTIDCIWKVANQLNWFFHDEDLSNLMDELSKKVIQSKNIDFKPKQKRAVFFDQYGKSFILALQYINALLNAGYDILYILSDYVESDSYITDQLSKHKNITVAVISKELCSEERAQQIYDLTIDYAPEKIFLHVKAFSVFNVVLPALPRGIQNYYIDLQDHAMWVKNHQIDYVIPYRQWGATIDIEKRGFKKEQVLLLPYYPIINNIPFQGFPVNTKDKVIIFTGGEYYKTIDKKNSYWNIIKGILEQNENAIIMYALKGDITKWQERNIEKIIGKDKFSNRFFTLGFRKDISEVFNHCDIYLGTAPMSGGLMCQYAAYYGKPILQYYNPLMAENNETEQVINYNSDVKISFTDKNALLVEAKRLIDDTAYRIRRGKELQMALISEKQFSNIFAKSIASGKSQVEINLQKINYKHYSSWWMFLERKGISNTRGYLLSILKKASYIVMPLSKTLQLLCHGL